MVGVPACCQQLCQVCKVVSAFCNSAAKVTSPVAGWPLSRRLKANQTGGDSDNQLQSPRFSWAGGVRLGLGWSERERLGQPRGVGSGGGGGGGGGRTGMCRVRGSRGRDGYRRRGWTETWQAGRLPGDLAGAAAAITPDCGRFLSVLSSDGTDRIRGQGATLDRKSTLQRTRDSSFGKDDNRL